jgi:ubiquinone biosynthesis monooxygenase Coq7
MACTVAVEEVIGQHYDSQIRTLLADGKDGMEKHKELIKVISKFRDEELHHHDTGLEHDAEKAPMYDIVSNVIKVGCKGAIWLSERI